MLYVGGSKTSSFHKYQKSILERSFAPFRHLNKRKLKKLIFLPGLRKQQVSAWYKNKRRLTSMFILESLCLLHIGNNSINCLYELAPALLNLLEKFSMPED